MSAKQGARRNEGTRRRRLLCVLAVTAAFSVLPPLEILPTPAGASEHVAPAIVWQTEYAEATPLRFSDLRPLQAQADAPADPAQTRIRLGLVLVLLAGLGGVTLKLWEGALRRVRP